MKHYEKCVYVADMKALEFFNQYWVLVAKAFSNQAEAVREGYMQYRRVDDDETVFVKVWENVDYVPEHNLDDVVQVEVYWNDSMLRRATVVRTHLREWIVKRQAYHAVENNAWIIGTVDAIHAKGLAREVFMELWRNSDPLKDTMTPDDAMEIFMGVLSEADLSVGLFDDLCREYGTSLNELAERDGHHFY